MFGNSKPFYYLYDLDSTSFKYGRLGGPDGFSVPGYWGVENAGSDPTVDAVDSQPAFAGVTEGGVIFFTEVPETVTLRKIATKTSNSSIEVDSAIDLSGGARFDHYPFKVGTADSDGWHSFREWSKSVIHVDIATYGGNPVVVSVEEDVDDLMSGPHVVEEQTYSAAGHYTIPINRKVKRVRVGLRASTDASGTDSIKVWASGEFDQQPA